ncbi:MAG: epoxide hydrolase N-terminal domain-containing protein [Actinoplanes sp.]
MIEPFRVPLDPAVVEDLRTRLHRTRWPDPETTEGWSQGTPLAVTRDLCAYWADG